jgi:hypothetical protein
VDGHSHHDHQKRDLQVSRKGVVDSCKGDKLGREGSKGDQIKNSIFESACTCICLFHVCYLQLLMIVFRL